MISKGPKTPVRVLHVFGGMNRGGAEMRTLDIMRSINRDSFHLDFCSLSGLSGELDPEIADLGGSTYLCKLGPLFPIQFLRLLKRERFDAVHSHVWLVSGIILLLARLAGVQTRIAHFRTTGTDHPPSRIRGLRDKGLRWLIHKNATDILAVSRGVMDTAWTAFRGTDDRCKVVYNGVDTTRFESTTDPGITRRNLGLRDGSRVFIHIGRFSPAKNHERLIQIYEQIRCFDDNSILLLVGGGDTAHETHIRSLVANRGLEEFVIFLGVRTDIADLIKASDVMILPSLREGLPGVVIEASATRTAVLASDLPGVREIAEQISTVHTLSLLEPDAMWAKQAMILAMSDVESKADKEPPLSMTEFTLEKSIDAHRAVWCNLHTLPANLEHPS